MHQKFKQYWEDSVGTAWPLDGEFTAGEDSHSIEKFANLIVEDIMTMLAAHALSHSTALEVYARCSEVYEGKFVSKAETNRGVDDDNSDF